MCSPPTRHANFKGPQPRRISTCKLSLCALYFVQYTHIFLREQIISIAKENGADAVIPGYGFLSENPDFARRLSESGIAFVGPPAEIIESLGLKHTARKCAVDAGVPIVPGSKGLVFDEQEAVEAACELGFPVSRANSSENQYTALTRQDLAC